MPKNQLTIHEVSLTPRQDKILTAITPAEYIKQRKGRGGKMVQYVEGGYVISQLNKTFSPLGWEFEIVEQGIEEKEVWVKGKLSIKDYKTGFSISKAQYGQHTREDKVPLGDTLKAAGTDSLKKCASLLGIGLDIMWAQMDMPEEKKPIELSPEQKFERAKVMIKATKNSGGLFEYLDKMKQGKTFNAKQKKELESLISVRIDEINAKTS